MSESEVSAPRGSGSYVKEINGIVPLCPKCLRPLKYNLQYDVYHCTANSGECPHFPHRPDIVYCITSQMFEQIESLGKP